MATGGSSSFSLLSFDCRGILGSHPSGATPAYTTLSSSRRGTGGVTVAVIVLCDVLPKRRVDAENARCGRVPWMNDVEEEGGVALGGGHCTLH